MKIVVKKNHGSTHHDFIVYLKTDDDIQVYAQMARLSTYNDVIANVLNQTNEDPKDIKIYQDLAPPTEPVPDNLPLILVMYMDRELMRNAEIMGPMSEAINEAISAREANAMAFFLPTDGEERIECINPLIATEVEKDRIGKLINEIEISFDINNKDVKDED